MAITIYRRPDDVSRIKLDSKFLRAMDVPLVPYIEAANRKFSEEFETLAAKLKAYFDKR